MAVITISRLPGALGDTLAAALAERLQYRLVERAQLMQLCEQLVGSDLGWERSPELRQRSASLWGRLNAEPGRYDGVLRRVTTNLAEQDNVVIVGLGAGQLLRGLRQVLRGAGGCPRGATPGAPDGVGLRAVGGATHT